MPNDWGALPGPVPDRGRYFRAILMTLISDGARSMIFEPENSALARSQGPEEPVLYSCKFQGFVAKFSRYLPLSGDRSSTASSPRWPEAKPPATQSRQPRHRTFLYAQQVQATQEAVSIRANRIPRRHGLLPIGHRMENIRKWEGHGYTRGLVVVVGLLCSRVGGAGFHGGGMGPHPDRRDGVAQTVVGPVPHPSERTGFPDSGVPMRSLHEAKGRGFGFR